MSRDTLETLTAALTDRYRVERLLGSGGMATVYLAHDLKHDRPVAIKVLRPELAAVLGRERFLREIQIAASLTHPHILPLHDSGATGDLLYYVMPYVAGESLQERVAREKQLPVEEAVRIAREVASALAYAHGHDIVHRDIKPANILLADGHVFVADFGLARAITQAKSSDAITQSGLTIGTPAYMSPEQAAGEGALDGRSDIYALGCVLYELLAGDPPFVSSNPAAVLARHAAAPVLPIRIARPAVPPWLSRALERALEKVPADRFQSANEFADALQPSAGGGRAVPRWTIGALLLAAAALAVWTWEPWGPPTGGAQADTLRYAVLPFERSAPGVGNNVEVMLQGALSRWSGINVVPWSEIAEKVGDGPLNEARGRRLAGALDAGRYLTGQILPVGDSLQVRALLHEGGTGAILAQRDARFALEAADSSLGRLAEELLFRGRLDAGPAEGPAGSESTAAVQAFIAGREAVRAWDLVEADSAFARALVTDPGFTRATVWLAQVRAWQGHPPRVWRLQAERAVAGRSKLGPRDEALATALSELSQRDYIAACARWRSMTQQWEHDFSAWYGLATCLRLDDGVRRDRASPSGWSFTSSYHQAQLAWRRSFEILPAVYRNFQTGGTLTNSWLLWTATNRVRGGRALTPDSGNFLAFPSWRGDTLAFVPYAERDFKAGRARVAASSTQEALRRQRRAFYELASEWRSADPRNPDAQEALAVSLWLLGNPTAPDSMRSARSLAGAGEDRSRLGLTEAVMLLLQGAPDDEGTVRRAKGLLDSLLFPSRPEPGSDPQDLTTMAALTGRADQAARLSRLPSRQTAFALPPGLTSDALALLSYASLAGPPESLATLVGRVSKGIQSAVDPAGQGESRMEWLARPLAISHMENPNLALDEVVGQDDYLIDAEAAYQRGDTAGARRRLSDMQRGRAWMQPSDVSFETLLPEAKLLAAMGDLSGALQRLDPTLSTLRSASLDIVRRPVGAALLIRAMAFRADLASRAGDAATAARWARVVVILWADADQFLQPVVQRMRHLARGERA